MHTVIGRIDLDIFKVVAADIATDVVVITDECLQHIKNRHPNDAERYFDCLRDIVEEPDYILEANKPNSAVLLKRFSEMEKNFQLVLRLKTAADLDGRMNSIITFMKIYDSKYRQFLRTKKILYKRE